MKGIGVSAIIIAILMGATTYSVIDTVVHVRLPWSTIGTTTGVVFILWLLMSIGFIVLTARWIYGTAVHTASRKRLSIATLAIIVPVFGTLDGTFTVIPFTLSARIAVSDIIIGVNFLPALLLALVWRLQKELDAGPSPAEMSAETTSGSSWA
jgi:hypothetical protein